MLAQTPTSVILVRVIFLTKSKSLLTAVRHILTLGRYIIFAYDAVTLNPMVISRVFPGQFLFGPSLFLIDWDPRNALDF